MTQKTNTSRRGLLIGALALGGVAWGWQRFGVRTPQPGFVRIEGLPGWRRVEYDGVSLAGGGATDAVLVGIGGTGPEVEPLPVAALCSALYGETQGSGLPVAMFSDFFCPYCRTLASRVAARADDPASGISLTWHELPLLGPASERAARAAIAADLQGGYRAFQDRLFSTPFRPTVAHLAQAASDAGLDPERLVADMEGEPVQERLITSRRAAETLGIWGTPAMTIGKTLVTGEIGDAALATIIDDERSRSGDLDPACRA